MIATQHPELTRLLTLVPVDAELARLASALDDAHAAEVTGRATMAAHRDRAAALDAQLRAGSVDAKGRQSLLLERAALTVEADLAPATLAAYAAGRARAELAYLARIAQLAQEAARSAMRTHDAAVDAWTPLGKRLQYLTASTGAQQNNAPEIAALHAQATPLTAQARTHAARHDRLRDLGAVARGFAQQRYGEEVNLTRRDTCDAAAVAAGKRAVRQATAPQPVAA